MLQNFKKNSRKLRKNKQDSHDASKSMKDE